jgi:hypothetical protein
MADGRGVPNMQPDLTASRVVTGSPRTLIDLVLRGPDKVLPPTRRKYSNAMPELSSLTDGEVAAVLTYVRGHFGGGAARIARSQVASVRAASSGSGK